MSTYSQEWLDFYSAGLDLVPQIAREPRLDLLRAYFEARLARWPHIYMEEEFWNSGNYDSLTDKLEPHVAFQLIPAATALLLEQTEPLRIANAGWLLIDIVRKSDTTELPPLLDSNWNAVMKLLELAGDDEARQDAQIAKDSLARWYRRHRPPQSDRM